MTRGQEIALAAMKKEHARLCRVAAIAKSEADEYASVGSEFIAIHVELKEIIESKETGDKVLKKLDALKKRSARAERIRDKDFMKLLDRQSDLEISRDELGREVHTLEWRHSKGIC